MAKQPKNKIPQWEKDRERFSAFRYMIQNTDRSREDNIIEQNPSAYPYPRSDYVPSDEGESSE